MMPSSPEVVPVSLTPGKSTTTPKTPIAKPSPSGGTTSASKTTEGTFICLPHKDTTGPQTMECAFGLKAADGSNYALDISSVTPAPTNLPTNAKKFAVSGTITPIEALSSNTWQKYDVKGIIKVTSYKEVASSTPVVSGNNQVTLKLNESVTIAGTAIKVGTVTQDSRCPSDVTCIQAGKVVIEVFMTAAGSPTKSSLLEIGKIIETPTLSIALDKVNPYPISTHKTTDSEYRFVLTVKVK